jgi:hypothetical protein
MKVITFYADPPNSTYYTDHAQKWVDSVKSYALDYHIEELSGGNYWENTRRKPQFILNCLNKFQDAVLWIDVDTTFQSYEPYKSSPFVALRQGKTGTALYSSCLHFEYCDESIKFVKLWNDLCVKNIIDLKSPQGDHHYLYKAIAQSNIEVKWFPRDFWSILETPFSPFGGSIHKLP